MRVALFALISALIAAVNFSSVNAQVGNTFSMVNDIATLNYALALENLEATYYACYIFPLNVTVSGTRLDCSGRGYPVYTVSDFTAAGYNTSVYSAVVAIGQQEISHSNLLNGAVQGYYVNNPGIPVSRCTYNLSVIGAVTGVRSFLQLAQSLENAGVSAYAGAVNTLTDPTLLQIAVSIADVEARHAAWVNQLLGTQPFATSGFDTALNATQVLGAIGGVFNQSTCYIPSGASAPAVRPYGVATSGTSGTVYTGRLSQANGLSYSSDERANDLLVLNYALSLEYLEAAFYNQAAQNFTQANFTAAGLSSNDYTYFGIIGANENTHVAALRAAISAYGGTPVSACTYNFGSALSSLNNYMQTALALENAGVSAYTGAASYITDTNLLQTAATIAMIEARHAGYIGAISTGFPRNDTNAFPRSQDTPLTPQQVWAAVNSTGFVSGCNSNVYNYPQQLSVLASLPSSTAGSVVVRSSSSSGGNGASSTSAFSAVLIVAAIIASLALVL